MAPLALVALFTSASKNTLWENRNLKAVGHSFQKIHYIRGLRTICKRLETLHSGNLKVLVTNLLAEVGARDAYASKNICFL